MRMSLTVKTGYPGESIKGGPGPPVLPVIPKKNLRRLARKAATKEIVAAAELAEPGIAPPVWQC